MVVTTNNDDDGGKECPNDFISTHWLDDDGGWQECQWFTRDDEGRGQMPGENKVRPV